MAGKSKKPFKLYTPAEKAQILAVAASEGLTGDQVAKRFGVADRTFFRWRGPVRSDAVARSGRKRGAGRRSASIAARVDVAAVRREVHAQVQKLLPQLIREEVEAALREGCRVGGSEGRR